MKVTKKSLIDTLRAKTEGKTSYQTRKIAKVSVRRVDGIWKEYLMNGEIPVIGKGVGRPMILIEDWEKELVKKFYEKYRVSADAIEKLIERDEKKHLSHYKIHKILIEFGYAEKKVKRDVRKKEASARLVINILLKTVNMKSLDFILNTSIN